MCSYAPTGAVSAAKGGGSRFKVVRLGAVWGARVVALYGYFAHKKQPAPNHRALGIFQKRSNPLESNKS